MATRSPAFLGIDRFDVPETPRAGKTQWLRLLFRNSTFRIVGAYLQFQAQRRWHDQLLAIRDDGWGTGAIYLGYSRESFVRKETVGGKLERHFEETEQTRWRKEMTGTAGTDHAAIARSLAISAHMRSGSILWFDNEDPSDVVFEQHELDYYIEFFREIAWTGTDRSAFRPGLYAHQRIAAQLLPLRPDLYLWETDYAHSERRTLPTLQPSLPADTQFGLDPSSADLVIKDVKVVPPAPARPWVAWPLWRQFEGNSQGSIPQRAVGTLTPLVNWDFNSSLVRDPSDAVATPRLRLCAIGHTAYVARLDDSDPQYNAETGTRQLPRRGRLRIYSSPSFRTPVEITSGPNWILGPAGPMVALVQDNPELLVLSTLSEFGSSRLSTHGWTQIEPLWSQDIYPEIRFPFAFDGCQLGDEKHLFYATTSGQIYSSRRKGTDPWGERRAAGDQLRVHPFGMIAACTRGDTVHTVVFDAQSNLVALQWRASDKVWPPASFTVVAGPVMPNSVAVASPSPSTVVAVVVGADLRPWRYVYRVTARGSSWSAGTPLGRDTDIVLSNARLALSVVDAGTLDLVATGSDGTPQRYTMINDKDWEAQSRTSILAPVPPGGAPAAFLPNPHGDISSSKLPSSVVPLVAFCGVGPGTVAALLSLITGSAIRLLD